jgi:hypothetical protein
MKRFQIRSLHTVVTFIVMGALVACGGSAPPQATDPTSGPDTTPATTAPITTAPPTSEPVPMAIWYSTGPEADAPETAAEAAIRDLLGVNAILSEFMAGDSMSGEIEVYSPSEASQVVRSLLLLRQLGPQLRWAVLAAINPEIQINAPADGGIYTPGPLTVSGLARGFEGTIIVSAHLVGTDAAPIDQQIGAGGSLADAEPFSVVLDLRNTQIGDVIAIVVRGDTGLEEDPGEFSIIAIQIG